MCVEWPAKIGSLVVLLCEDPDEGPEDGRVP